MHNWKLWTGVILALVALLPSLGVTLGIIPVFSGLPLVIIAILGGYLLAGHRRR